MTLSPQPIYRIEMFGGLKVTYGGVTVTRFRTVATGSLLAYLAYHAGRAHPRERLIDLFWPQAEPQSGRARLSQAVHALRQQLSSPLIPPDSLFFATNAEIGVRAEAITNDAAEFRDCLQRAETTASPLERGALLERAVELRRGDFLTGFYDEWVLMERTLLDAEYETALYQLGDALLEAGDLPRALNHARRAAANDPSCEAARSTLMRIYASMGRSSAALKEYSELRRILVEEGLPGPSTRIRELARDLEARLRQAPPDAPAPIIVPHPSKRRAAGALLWLLAASLKPEQNPAAAAQIRTSFEDLAQRHGGAVLSAGAIQSASFSSSGEAIRCALEIQSSSGADTASRPAVALDIRETPAGTPDDLDLRLPAGMLIAAHPAQILVSDAAAGLARRQLPPDTSLCSLGLYQLSGSDRPERLFLLEYPGASRYEFPRPRAEPAQCSQLPVLYTRFFGRIEELETLRGFWGSGRLVTLIGPAGCGKTRLALQAATAMLRDGSDPVWFVPLADLRDPNRIPNAILDALLLPQSPQTSAWEQVTQALRQHPGLLVMDNLEQFGDEVAAITGRLMECAPDLRILATSRRRLGLDGEQVYYVNPLRPPAPGADLDEIVRNDCVQLFVDRARILAPHFQLTSSNAGAVAALCRRLEGLPLAIELAAARIRVLTPAQMIAQLEAGNKMLQNPRPGLPARHQSLDAAIAWSADLLPPSARRLFARLSVFRGGCSLAAAHAVAGEDRDIRGIIDDLDRLQEHSLVGSNQADQELRFPMLEPVREFAAEQLEMAEIAALERSHALYYQSLAEARAPDLTGPLQLEAQEALSVEIDNFRKAEQWAYSNQEAEIHARLVLALYPLLRRRGLWTEALEWLRRCWSRLDEAEDSDRFRAGAACGMADLEQLMGATEEARRHAAVSLEIRRRLQERGALAEILNIAGLIAADQGDLHRAQASFTEALALCDSDEHCRKAIALHNLGRLESRRGDKIHARALYASALQHREATQDYRGLADTLGALGAVVHVLGEHGEARRLYTESLGHYRRIQHPYGIALMLNNLAELEELEGRLERAFVFYHHAARGFQKLQASEQAVPRESLARLRRDVEPDRLQFLEEQTRRVRWEDFFA